jgi:branched-chain amino acid transport system ATP-binding protein
MAIPIKIDNLTKTFEGVKAVANLCTEFRAGEITGLIGPNGSGKTTLTNLLSGLMPFSSGVVHMNGIRLTHIPSHQVATYGLTRTFQEVRLFEQMTVLDNILVVCTERPVFTSFFEKHTRVHEEQAQRALTQVGLWEKRHQLASKLSYGQRKLLEIARALCMKADIYLFDEPFAGLFKEMVKTVVVIMQDLKAQGKTIVLIEHNMDLIRQLSNRVLVLDAGELLAEGSPETVLGMRKVIEAYLGD